MGEFARQPLLAVSVVFSCLIGPWLATMFLVVAAYDC